MTPAEIILKAKTPEDIFGPTATGVKDKFREYAVLFHPDKNHGDKNAAGVFQVLNMMKEDADQKIAEGTYGDPDAMKPVVLNTKKAAYTLTRRMKPGDLTNVYSGVNQDKQPVLVKITRVPSNNDLVRNEAEKLKWFRTDAKAKALKVMQHIPVLVDSFELDANKIKKQVNVFWHYPRFVSLEDVLKAFPDGIPLENAAWMINRLLGALLAAHQSGLVHCAVLPSHVLVLPDESNTQIVDGAHNGMLIDWSYSRKVGDKLTAVVPRYRDLYPPEFSSVKLASFGFDLYMVAMCLLRLIGGKGTLVPHSVPKEVAGIIRHCLLGAKTRQDDVGELYDDFGKALKAHFGPPKFRHFVMPSKK